MLEILHLLRWMSPLYLISQTYYTSYTYHVNNTKNNNRSFGENKFFQDKLLYNKWYSTLIQVRLAKKTSIIQVKLKPRIFVMAVEFFLFLNQAEVSTFY